MQLHSGEPFWPLAPTEPDIAIEDIAHALSMVCRYGGHVKRFYSVAEHCVLLSHTVAPEHALWALLHDATEAYIGDMVWPLKEEVPQYQAIEDRLMAVIASKFSLPSSTMPEQVWLHDRRIVADEREQLMAPSRLPWPSMEGYDPLGVAITGWHPTVAEEMYLLRFRQLYHVI